MSSRQTAWEKGSIYVHILQSCALLFTVLTTDMRTLSRATHIRTNIHANQMRSRTSFSHSTEPRADKSPKTEALLSDVPLSRHDLKGRMPVMNKQKNETKKGRCAATAGKTSYTLADAPSCRGVSERGAGFKQETQIFRTPRHAHPPPIAELLRSPTRVVLACGGIAGGIWRPLRLRWLFPLASS